jgi:[protein-PII] uridylyltransferase
MSIEAIEALHHSFETQSIGISTYIRTLTHTVDTILIKIWEESGLAELDTHLIALGGYGRQELFPYSDIDSLVLIPQLSPTIEAALERFNQQVWDKGFKLHLSHEYLDSPRMMSEVELSTQTSWLESRLIAGDPIDYSRWHHRILKPLDIDHFIQSKIFEQQQRHIRYEEAQTSLEPDIKEHPGGLRDLHTLLWVDRARYGRRSIDQMLSHYGFSSYEIRRIQRAHSLQCNLRAHLHLISRREENTLRYDLHLAIAERLGIHRNASRLLASERLMQHYYRMSRLIQQANQLILSQIQHPIPPIAPSQGTLFFVNNHQLCLRDAQCLVEAPSLLFTIFITWQNTLEALDIHPATQRLLWDHRHLLDAPQFELRQRLQHAFIQILRGKRRIHRCLRYLHKLELLERYLPDWQRIRGQIQHDYMHRYPVDEHNLMVVRYLRRMVNSRYRDELPEAVSLIKAFERPEVLWIAGLLHDIGKGLDGDHSTLGAAKVRTFAENHQLPHEDIHLLEWLIQEHLTLSHVAQKQDINNPEVVQAFVAKLPSERALVALYLLTIADVRGTNPKLWNPWRSHLFTQLFHNALAVLHHQDNPIDPLQSIQNQVLNTKTPPASPPTFWNTLEPSYFYRHTPEELRWHLHLLEQHEQQPLIESRRFQGTWQFFIYWKDQPGIFFHLCSFFSAKRLSVVEAKIVTAKNGWILDSYSVLEPEYEFPPDEIQRFCKSLTATLKQASAFPDLSKPHKTKRLRLSRRQQALPLHPEIQIDPDIHHAHRFSLHIVTSDREALWADIAFCLWQSGISVHDARIQTLGERVESVLKISGTRLHLVDEQAKLEASLFKLLYPV